MQGWSPGLAQPCVRETLSMKCNAVVLANGRGADSANSFGAQCSERNQPGLQQRFHPTRAAREGTPAWAGIPLYLSYQID
jgi:hypothetical protein